MSDGFRREFTAALELLAEAFSAAEARGTAPPVIVGGAAVEFYTAGGIQSADFDVVSLADDILLEELEARGFRRSYDSSLRGLYHPALLLAVDFVSGSLFEGRTGQGRIMRAIVDASRGTTVSFAPVEDMIADRLGRYESAPGGVPAMLEQARLLLALADEIDETYLRRRVGEECADVGLLDLLGIGRA